MKLTNTTRLQIIIKCFKIAIVNGWEFIPDNNIKKYANNLSENDYYWLLFDTSNGFSKALFGEPEMITDWDFENKFFPTYSIGWKEHLTNMIGVEPVVYLYNWIKSKGIKI